MEYYSIFKNDFNLSSVMDFANLHSKDSSQFTLVGSKISSWNDGISAWVQGTDANRPTLSTFPNFDGANDQIIRSSEISTTNFSMYLIFKDTGAVGKIFLGAQSASDYMIHNSPANAYDAIALNVGGVTKQTFSAGIKGNRYSILSIRRNGNTLTAKLNDRTLISRTATYAGQATLIARLMSYTGAGFFMAGGVKAFCMSSQHLSDADDAKVRNKLYSDYNMSADNAAECLEIYGDSNSFGTGSTSYGVSLASSLGVRDANIAISGSLFTGALASAGFNRYKTDLITRPYTDYIGFQYCTNDILAGVSTTVYGPKLNEMLSELLAVGYNPNRICLVSPPYQRDGANATALDNYKTLLENAATTFGLKFWDLLGWMRSNGGNALLSDTVHITQTAQNAQAAGMLTAFTS